MNTCKTCGAPRPRQRRGGRPSKWPRPWVCNACGRVNVEIRPTTPNGFFPSDLEGWAIQKAWWQARRIARFEAWRFWEDIRQEALAGLYTFLAAFPEPDTLQEEMRAGWLKGCQAYIQARVHAFLRLCGYRYIGPGYMRVESPGLDGVFKQKTGGVS